jgi:hypothetical protein
MARDGNTAIILYARRAERLPVFAEYPKRTSRRLPVIALERVGDEP